MKRATSLFLGLFFLLSAQSLFSQTPNGVNYQAVVRNSVGLPLGNQSVSVRFTIHQGSPTGTPVFQETQLTNTNQFGLINLELGSVNTAAFSSINWATGGAYYLQIEVDAGFGFDDLGASQLLSVPYALFAKSAATGAQGYNSLLDTVSAGASCPNGGYQVLLGLDTNANTVLDPVEVTSSFFVCNGTSGLSINWQGSFPTAPLGNSNDAYYNSTDGISYIFNGGTLTWDTLVAGGSGGVDNDWVVNGVDMYSDPAITGHVGIGTNTPAMKLHVETGFGGLDGILINTINPTGNTGLSFQTQGSDKFVLGVHQLDNNKFKIATTNYSAINTRFTIDSIGHVGIGNINPDFNLSVFSSDSVIASFAGTNPIFSAVSISNPNPNSDVGLILLTGSDTAIFGINSSNKMLVLDNSITDGHIALNADSTVVLYGEVIGNIAVSNIFNQTLKITNNVDTIYSYSSSGTLLNVNQGSFLTDSLYVFGNNMLQPNWLLANDGAGQAKWTDPSTLGLGGLWQSNTPNIYFNTGSVGIGTTTPGALLDVGASTTTLTIRATNTNTIGGTAGYFNNTSNTNPFAALIVQVVNSAAPSATFSGGNVGIGTTTPTQLLHLYNGTLRIDDGVSPYNLPSADGAANEFLKTDGSGNLTWAVPPSSSLWSQNGSDINYMAGRVGIGIAAPVSSFNIIYTGADGEASLVNYTNNSVAGNGTGYYVSANNTGTGVITAGGFQVSTSANASETVTIDARNISTSSNINYGIKSKATGIGTGTNIAGYFEASGATNNYALQIKDGTEGIGKVLISDASGNAIWKDKQIAFEARSNNVQNIDNLPSLLQLDAVIFDDGGNFDPTAGSYMFITPVNGIYAIQANLLFDFVGTGSEIIVVEFWIDGITKTHVAKESFVNGEQVSIQLSGTVKLNAGEKLQVKVYSQNGTPGINILGDENTWFSGHLVYAY
jgi:hypothetical protein